MPEIRIEIPGLPPSGNHYKNYRVVVPRRGKRIAAAVRAAPHDKNYRVVVPRRGKPIVLWYLTPKAKAWFRDVAILARGQKIRGETYSVSFVVFLPDARTRDVDNFFKCILDAMAETHGCGVIDDDKRVVGVHGYRRIDRTNPRTVVVVRTAQKELL